jgi:hypothetical protein
MADEPLYALVQGNRLHRYPAFEEDNLDDATVVQRNLRSPAPSSAASAASAWRADADVTA